MRRYAAIVSVMVAIWSVAAQAGPRFDGQATNQVGEQSQRVNDDGERSPRHVANPQAEHWATKTYDPSYYFGPEDQGSDQAKVDPDCRNGAEFCPDEVVCNNGDCNKNYLIMFTAKWCQWCVRMHPKIKELRKEGYIIYVFDVDKYPKAAEKFRAEKLPTFVFMDGGKEIERLVGFQDEEELTKRLKTRKEQDIPRPEEPTEPDYNLL